MSSSKIIGCGLLLFVMCLIGASMAQDELQDMQLLDDEKEETKREILMLLHRIQSLLDPSNDTDLQEANAACRCANLECACCQRIRIPQIRLDQDCCLSIKYLKRNIGLLLTLRIGSRTLFSKEISVRNPIPICVGVPYLIKGASVCIQLNDVNIGKRSVGACSTLLVRLVFVTVAKIPLGCFNINFLDGMDAVSALEQPSYDWIETPQDEAMPVFEEHIQPTFQEVELK